MPPSDQRAVGLLIASIGAIVVLAGVVMMRGGLGWFGHLPGDIRIQRENVRIYFPLGSMILVSIVLSAISYIVRRFF
jgi:hypothetical protein